MHEAGKPRPVSADAIDEVLDKRAVADAAARILGLDRIEADEEFSLRGLDSLMALELRNAVQRSFRVSIPVALLLDRATVRTIADAIQSALPNPMPVEAMEPEGDTQALLDRLPEMSDEDVDTLLAALLEEGREAAD
jgi:acyl carrier protein